MVVVIARWVLVLAGLALALWNPTQLTELRTQVAVLLVLAGANFYLHAHLLRRKPVTDAVAYGTSAADLLIITLLILTQGGYESQLYVFYFVALLAIAVAFPLRATAVFTGSTVGLYTLASIATLPPNPTDLDLLSIISRAVMLVAVAVCGQIYLLVEATRTGTGAISTKAAELERQERAQDVFFGQVAMIWARWFVILAGAIMTLWMSSTPESLALSIVPVVVLMGLNFYLHARQMLDRPANPLLVKLISGIDLCMITAIVSTWDGHVGLESPFFVYYYPVVLAFAFVFPPRQAAMYSAIALAAYILSCLTADPEIVSRTADVKLLTVRLVALASMGGLGTYFWREQRRQARAVHESAGSFSLPAFPSTVSAPGGQ